MFTRTCIILFPITNANLSARVINKEAKRVFKSLLPQSFNIVCLRGYGGTAGNFSEHLKVYRSRVGNIGREGIAIAYTG